MIKASYTAACDACGVVVTEEDQTFCAECRRPFFKVARSSKMARYRAQVGPIDRGRAARCFHPYPMIGEDGVFLGWLDSGEPGTWGTLMFSPQGIGVWETDK